MKARTLMLPPILTVILVGCGSASTTTTTPTTPTNPAIEAAKAAHDRATAAKEEAETAAVEARTKREQAATEHRERAERADIEAQKAARTKAREHAKAVQQHREEAKRHHYSAVFRASYIGSCTAGGHESTCVCALVKAEEKWSEAGFEAQPSSALEAVVKECQNEGK